MHVEQPTLPLVSQVWHVRLHCLYDIHANMTGDSNLSLTLYFVQGTFIKQMVTRDDSSFGTLYTPATSKFPNILWYAVLVVV